jgi:hypothetical protein
LFLGGWLKWWWLVMALLALGVGFWRMWAQAPKLWVPSPGRRAAWVGAAVGAILAAGVVFSGIGGISYQHFDHNWRNAIFEMLVAEPWPVVIPSPAGEIALTYYFAYWLPAALVGKAFGMAWGWAALLAWTWLGLALFACLALCLVKRLAVWPVAVFAVFGGMDLVQKAILGTLGDFTSERSFEWVDSTSLYAYTAFGDQLGSVFNQAIPAWILTALIFAQRDSRSVVALCAVAAIQCPLPALGAAVIALAWLITLPRPGPQGAPARAWARLRATALEALTPQNLILAGLCLPVFGSFFAANLNQAALTAQIPQTWADWARLAVFWVFEFGLMFALVGARCRATPVWWAALAIMLVLPLMRFGLANDLAMRAVIPAQVALYLMVCWTLAAAKHPLRSLQAAALVAVLALGTGSVLHKAVLRGEADLRAVKMVVDGQGWRAARDSLTRRLPVSWREDPTAQEGVWRQYFGDPDSFFYRTLSRAAKPSPSPPHQYPG